MNISPQTHAFCDRCDTIRPFSIADLHGDDASGQFSEASDLLCATCGFVITTFYTPKASTLAAAALRRHLRP